MNKTDLIVRVKWKANINGRTMEGVETEASWFMFNQIGTVFLTGPLRGPTPCNDLYEELTPLIKIGEKFMSVKEIESAIIPPYESK
jgi:hypothetical protein